MPAVFSTVTTRVVLVVAQVFLLYASIGLSHDGNDQKNATVDGRFAATSVGLSSSGAPKALRQTNVLFIMADDLRPELSIYGKQHMITPNFERLAARAVTFDLALCQVAVCNPSRDSLLTGLRPDTMATYGFQTSYPPNILFPQHFIKAGYQTASYGKIRHWDGPDPGLWTHDHYNGDWYSYQNYEWDHMNSTVMPDKNRPEETFPDYIFTSKLIDNIRYFYKHNSKYFFSAIGFKMPHTALHVPYSVFNMYRNRRHIWKNFESAGRLFPPTAPAVAWRCCAAPQFRFMEGEGALQAQRYEDLEDMNQVFSSELYEEHLWGYSAAISFVDKQLGRILDVIDELNLWENLTIVLTADHGMHNGEKALWEKWTLFDEATRVPLIIAHPQSPFKGQHYREAVELVDVFPSIIDLVGAPEMVDLKLNRPSKDLTHGEKLVRPAGKSLAPVVLGQSFFPQSRHTVGHGHGLGLKLSGREREAMPVLSQNFGISQAWKCCVKAMSHLDPRKYAHMKRQKIWYDCDINNATEAETSVMGYSMRSASFRYTAWVHVNRTTLLPMFDEPLFAEELYDHRGEVLGDLTHLELVNVVKSPEYEEIALSQKEQLLYFLQTKVVYKNGHLMPKFNSTLPRSRLRRGRQPISPGNGGFESAHNGAGIGFHQARQASALQVVPRRVSGGGSRLQADTPKPLGTHTPGDS